MPWTEQEIKEIERTYQAPEGFTWVCLMCGKTARNRDQFMDVSCFIHAVVIKNTDLKRDETGEVIAVQEVAFDPQTDRIRA